MNIEIGHPMIAQNNKVIRGEESIMAFFEKTAATEVSKMAKNLNIIPLLVKNFQILIFLAPSCNFKKLLPKTIMITPETPIYDGTSSKRIAENINATTGLKEFKGPKTDRSVVFSDLTRNMLPKMSSIPSSPI